MGAFRAYRDYQMEYADALAALAVSQADLERVVGGDMNSEGEMK